jgi:hypothetical protein
MTTFETFVPAPHMRDAMIRSNYKLVQHGVRRVGNDYGYCATTMPEPDQAKIEISQETSVCKYFRELRVKPNQALEGTFLEICARDLRIDAKIDFWMGGALPIWARHTVLTRSRMANTQDEVISVTFAGNALRRAVTAAKGSGGEA